MKLGFSEVETEDLGKKEEVISERASIYFPSKQISNNIKQLRERIFKTIETRERLPQPLFWSLFHAQLSEIYRQREMEKKKRAAFLGIK